MPADQGMVNSIAVESGQETGGRSHLYRESFVWTGIKETIIGFIAEHFRQRMVEQYPILNAETQAELRKRFPAAERAMAEGGALWIVWPKKSSGRHKGLGEIEVRLTLRQQRVTVQFDIAPARGRSIDGDTNVLGDAQIEIFV